MDTRWLPLDEYVGSEVVQSRPALRAAASAMEEYKAGRHIAFQAEALPGRGGATQLVLKGASRA